MSDVRMLTVAQAAQHAQVSRQAISGWIAEGLLVAVPQGRTKLIRSDHLQQLMRDRYQAARQQIPRDRNTPPPPA